VSITDGQIMNMKNWMNDKSKKKKFLEKNLSQSHVVCQKVLERCSTSIFGWTELVDMDAAGRNCPSDLPV